MSDDLFSDFTPSQLHDNSCEQSIERVLDEATGLHSLLRSIITADYEATLLSKKCSLEASLASQDESATANVNLEDSFSSYSQGYLEELEEDLRGAVTGDSLEAQLALLLKSGRRALFWSRLAHLPDFRRERFSPRFAGKFEETKTFEVNDSRFQEYIPTRLAELVVEHVWPDDPLRFYSYAVQHAKLPESRQDDVLQLYGDSPESVLIDALSKPENLSQHKNLIWNNVGRVFSCDITDREQELLLQGINIAERVFHALLDNRAFEAADELLNDIVYKEHDLPGYSPVTSLSSALSNQLKFEQLLDKDHLDAEEQRVLIELAFETKNSFMEPDCPTELRDLLIRASMENLEWNPFYEVVTSGSDVHGIVLRDGSVVEFSRSEDLKLHYLWCSSSYQNEWLSALELRLDSSTVAEELKLLRYLLSNICFDMNIYSPKKGEESYRAHKVEAPYIVGLDKI